MTITAGRTIMLWVWVLLLPTVPTARGAGVTIVTHGFNGNVTDWIIPMAAAIPDYDLFPGTGFSCYVISVASDYTVSISRIGGLSPLVSDSGEIIIKLDWSQLATTVGNSTTDIAESVVPALLSTTFVSELGGRSLSEFPIHLIGHSRGGSVVSEMARLLGAQGVWVDHLTALDPHPVTGFPYYDAEVYVYWNTLFADNYWQTNPDLSCPNGESIFGAYNRYLANLDNGYACNHSDVHLWYHGTIDWSDTPVSDTQATITSAERSTWWTSYEAQGLFAGFNWSLIGGGNRLSTNYPAGTANGNGKIRDGYNQSWDLGAGVSGNRYLLPSNNGSWPNLIKFDFLATNAVTAGDSVSMKYFFKFGSSASQTATVQVYLDRDANPYDGNAGQVAQYTESGTGTNSLLPPRTFTFSTSNTPPGQYYVFGKISYGTHVRYLEAPGSLTVRDGAPPAVSITNPPNAKTYTNAQTVTIVASATDNVAVTSVAFYDGSTLMGTDTSAPYTFDWSFAASDNGMHPWTARAYDAAGNASTSGPIALTVSIDITPPDVAISTPTSGQTITTNIFTVTGTASDPGSPTSGVSLVRVRINGGSWSNATGTTSCTRTATLTNCGNTIEAQSLDRAGNYSSIASNFVTYIPPNTAPSLPDNISPPPAAREISVTPTLQASPFSDPDQGCIGDTHAASQWQVLTPGAILVADSGTDTVNRITWTVPAQKLYYGSNYQWQVRYRDSRNAWSSYSTRSWFTNGGPLVAGTRQGTNIVLNWPTNSTGFTLQWSTNLQIGNWSNATPPGPFIANGQYVVTNSATNQFRFYRLKKEL